MTESDTSKTFIYEHTESIQTALSQYTECTWDDRHQALLAEFSVDHADAIMAILLQSFSHSWDNTTIKKANPILKHKAKHFAELQKSQRLLTKDINGSEDLMAVWWPWGHGATVSVRIFQGNQQAFVAQSGIFNKLAALISNPPK
jgi:hypothetical protein